MPIVQFFLTDVQYRIIGGKAIIYLYGRATDGEQICVTDAHFEPYFYVLPKKGKESSLRAELEKLQVKDESGTFSVVRVDDVSKRLREHEINVFKVVTNLPSAVPVIRESIKGWDSVDAAYEYDIKYVRRYLLDRKLTPLVLTEANVEPTQEKSKVPVLSAKSIRQVSEETLRNPRILAVDIETYNPKGKLINPKEYPIVMLGLYGEDFQKVVSWKQFPSEPFVEHVPSEADVLLRFVELVEQVKPDILVSYNGDGFDLPYIRTRADKYKLRLPVGLDYTDLKIQGTANKTAQMAGVAHVDIFRFIRRVIGRSMKTDTFTLDEVSKELLGTQKVAVPLDRLADDWDNHPENLHQFAVYNVHDARLTNDLIVKLWPNIVELVKIVGLPLWDVSRMSFSQLVEWFVIKQAADFNEIVLNKPNYAEQMERMGKRFKGAFVFEPTPGLYKDIVVFDYKSLYPSIIASHNISIGTLNCQCCQGIKRVPLETANLWFCTKRKGFISTIIADLIERRNRIKDILKKEEKKDPLLSARSESLKLLANAFYGYLGFAQARWYSFECGESVTAYGRDYITQVIEKAQKIGFKVLYSDTDSIFLLLDSRSKNDALTFIDEINKHLPGVMELDYENYYPRGIFVALKSGTEGAKKRYALIDEKGNLKIRGFETVRRNTSPIAKKVQKTVLEIVLKEGDAEKAVAFLRQKVDELRKHITNMEEVTIHTVLQKEVSEYESVGPHVAAAQRMANRGTPIGAGTHIRYVVTKGKGPIRDRVHLPDEITKDDYDPEYYIENQVIPGVERIFAVLGFKKEDLVQEKTQSTLGSFL